MSNNTSNKDDTVLLSFLYILQKRRKINPLWVLFFTKEGWVYIAIGYFLFFMFNGGALSLAAYLGLGIWGNRRFNYRYYEHDKMYFFKKLIRFTSKESK